MQMDREARKYTYQQDVEKYEMTFEFQGEMPFLAVLQADHGASEGHHGGGGAGLV